MSRKSFGSDRPLPKEGPVFDVSGQNTDGRRWEETFHCKPTISTRLIPDFQHSLRIGGGQVSTPDVLAFIRATLVEDTVLASDDEKDAEVSVVNESDDRERWDALLDDETRFVEAQDLYGIANWLQEQYTGRPTGPSRRS